MGQLEPGVSLGESEIKKEREKTTAPRIPAWSPTVVLTGRPRSYGRGCLSPFSTPYLPQFPDQNRQHMYVSTLSSIAAAGPRDHLVSYLLAH